MEKAPSSVRKTIVIAGRTNTGKSSLINAICDQEVAIVSDTPGTTTDAIGKAYELLGLGAVTFYDTAGLDDKTELGEKRINATKKMLKVADLVLVVSDNTQLGNEEKELIENLDAPYLVVYNKADITKDSSGVSAITGQGIAELKEKIKEKLKSVKDNKILSDIVNTKARVLLVAPCDASAPEGRIILPQVQVLRELLDIHAIPTVVQLEEVAEAVKDKKFDLVITDSRVVKEVNQIIPAEMNLTTFSILFGRRKGDFQEFVRGVKRIDSLKDGDKILIAEACSHTIAEDDIGREMLPKLLRKHTGKNLEFKVVSGRNFPEDLNSYSLVLHCGACMITKNEQMHRINECKALGIPITNYGLTISKCQGILDRVLEPLQKHLLAA